MNKEKSYARIVLDVAGAITLVLVFFGICILLSQ